MVFQENKGMNEKSTQSARAHSLPPTMHNLHSNFQNFKLTLTIIFSKPILGVSNLFTY